MIGPTYLTSSYRKQRVISPLHTSGPVLVFQNARRVITCTGDKAILTNVENGLEICQFSIDSSSITAMALSPSETTLAIITSSLSLRTYTLPNEYSQPLSKPLQPIRHVAKAHDAPVHVATIDPSSCYIATGSADGVVKVWDLHRGFVTHVFKGHGGVISCLAFHLEQAEDENAMENVPHLILASGSVDTRIRLFYLSASNLRSSKDRPSVVLDGHVSVPRGISFSSDGKWLLTGGRDSVVLLWDLKPTQTSKPKSSKENSPVLSRTIPVSENVEALGILDTNETIGDSTESSQMLFYIGGSKGTIRIWAIDESRPRHIINEAETSQSDDAQDLRSIQDIIYCRKASTLVSIHADQNILFHSLKELTLSRQLIGFNDEIVDAVFISASNESQNNPTQRIDTHVAIATNSALIRVYSTIESDGLDARLLSGHGDTVLALCTSSDGRFLASGSKDRSIRVWAPAEAPSTGWNYVAFGEGHTESIGAIALSNKQKDGSPPAFVVSGSQDRTIKIWDLTGIRSTASNRTTPEEVTKLKSVITQKVHEKDVNSLDVSPNDSLIATGSQDKTAKIFEIQHRGRGEFTLKPVGVLKGHKRGIWNVKFSKTERLIATASGDKSVKLWTLDNFSCIKTFEGHTNSVLRVEFINNGLQLLSTASDGLLKLWSIQTEDCVATMDNHEDKVWGLAVSRDEQTVVTAAADSVITFWSDSTEVEQKEKERKKEELVSKEQDLENYIALQDFKNAIVLALSMEHPRKLYNLFHSVSLSRISERSIDGNSTLVQEGSSITGSLAVDEVIRTLPYAELAKLLHHVRDWNTTAKTSNIAQMVLYAILKLRPSSDIQKAFHSGDFLVNMADLPSESIPAAKKNSDGMKEVIEALIPYSERHFNRIERLIQDSYILDFLIGEMDAGVVEDEDLMAIDS